MQINVRQYENSRDGNRLKLGDGGNAAACRLSSKALLANLCSLPSMIYNLHPAESEPEKPYKSWADGRSLFDRGLYERIGFTMLAFDENDTEFVRTMGKTLGWVEMMDLEKDLFRTYTLLRK